MINYSGMSSRGDAITNKSHRYFHVTDVANILKKKIYISLCRDYGNKPNVLKNEAHVSLYVILK